ncbi:MAG: SDR family oxidoreductase [Proteobacteria bacterium]|nr:SDR family oxidoreductase [Pseudomonadota bacterium]
MTGALLAGRRAVVTGATRGIGRAIAARLRDDGAEVLVTGTSPDGSGPEGCAYHPVDFTDLASTRAFCRAVEAFAPLVLVNNAGVSKPEAFAEISAEEFQRVQDINLRGTLMTTQAALPSMRTAGWGRIVSLGSIRQQISLPGRASYSAAKAGVDGLTIGLAAEVAKDGILANVVAPGFIDTEMTASMYSPDQIAALAASIPIGRLAKPEEIAAFVAWLAGPENTYISGQSLFIDGGITRV